MSKKNTSLRDELKSIFRGYKRLTKKINHELSALGIKVVVGKTHIKIYYMNNASKYVTVSKTSSDWRTGLNVCTQLNSLILASS